MPYNEKEKERTMKYARDNIKRIPLDVPLKDYAGIKASAEAAGQGVNTYIKQAIQERQEREESRRRADCPLSEVPAHGRLIDANKLREEMLLFIKENLLTRDDARELLATVDEAPTVIEAED